MHIPFVESEMKNFDTFRRKVNDSEDTSREKLLTTIEELERELRLVEDRS